MGFKLKSDAETFLNENAPTNNNIEPIVSKTASITNSSTCSSSSSDYSAVMPNPYPRSEQKRTAAAFAGITAGDVIQNPYKRQRKTGPTSTDARVVTQELVVRLQDEFADLWLPEEVVCSLADKAEQEYVTAHSNNAQKSMAASWKEVQAQQRPPKQHEQVLPTTISLTQMIDEAENACDNGMENNKEKKSLINHMFNMRLHLEAYINQKVSQFLPGSSAHQKLYNNINDLEKVLHFPADFCVAMHRIRVYGNKAAHHQPLPDRTECERAVESYLRLQSQYEQR
jgi:hypothetical protein